MKKNPIMDEILSESDRPQPFCQGCRISDEDLSGKAWAGNAGPTGACVPSAPLKAQAHCAPCRISDEELGAVALPGNCIQDCVIPARQIRDEELGGAVLAGNNSCSQCTNYVD